MTFHFVILYFFQKFAINADCKHLQNT